MAQNVCHFVTNADDVRPTSYAITYATWRTYGNAGWSKKNVQYAMDIQNFIFFHQCKLFLLIFLEEYSVMLHASLKGEPNTYLAGTLLVFVEGFWARVCYDDFSLASAAVVCRQLGYGEAITTRLSKQHPLLDKAKVTCQGSESSLEECDVRKHTGRCKEYQSREDVEIICSGIEPPQLGRCESNFSISTIMSWSDD